MDHAYICLLFSQGHQFLVLLAAPCQAAGSCKLPRLPLAVAGAAARYVPGHAIPLGGGKLCHPLPNICSSMAPTMQSGLVSDILRVAMLYYNCDQRSKRWLQEVMNAIFCGSAGHDL